MHSKEVGGMQEGALTLLTSLRAFANLSISISKSYLQRRVTLIMGSSSPGRAVLSMQPALLGKQCSATKSAACSAASRHSESLC